MTPKKIINIYAALSELNSVVFPYKVARKIAGLNKRVREEFEIIVGQETALVKKYEGKRERDGKITFYDTEKAEKFAEEFEAMQNEDVDISLVPVDISKYVDGLQLTPQSIEALEGVIIFEVGDDDGDS